MALQPISNQLKVRLKGLRLKLTFLSVTALQPIYWRTHPTDVAFMYSKHPILVPFILNISKYLGKPIHLKAPDSDFSSYRKVIIPNGLWSNIREFAEKIPSNKRVYCEVGFFPQNRNVYFDDLGVHGHSSLRFTPLQPLNDSESQMLACFKKEYTRKNFIKVRWDSIEDQPTKTTEIDKTKTESFIFVPLQLEADTAFDLCPFNDNQEIINAIEKQLPGHRIIFKLHPLDESQSLTVSPRNTILPKQNRDLRFLIQNADAVVSVNSTVMLEALLHGKKCASLGIGFSTNHNVSLECHNDIDRLKDIDSWEPNPDKVDQFLYMLIKKQINVEFWGEQSETKKLQSWLKKYAIL